MEGKEQLAAVSQQANSGNTHIVMVMQTLLQKYKSGRKFQQLSSFTPFYSSSPSRLPMTASVDPPALPGDR